MSYCQAICWQGRRTKKACAMRAGRLNPLCSQIRLQGKSDLLPGVIIVNSRPQAQCSWRYISSLGTEVFVEISLDTGGASEQRAIINILILFHKAMFFVSTRCRLLLIGGRASNSNQVLLKLNHWWVTQAATSMYSAPSDGQCMCINRHKPSVSHGAWLRIFLLRCLLLSLVPLRFSNYHSVQDWFSPMIGGFPYNPVQPTL